MVAALVIPAAVLVWAALVAALYGVSHTVAEMSVLEARAFALGFGSYVMVFVGFVAGVVALVRREGAGG